MTNVDVDVVEGDTPSKTEVDTPSKELETKSEEEKSTTDGTNTKDGEDQAANLVLLKAPY